MWVNSKVRKTPKGLDRNGMAFAKPATIQCRLIYQYVKSSTLLVIHDVYWWSSRKCSHYIRLQFC